MMINFVLTSAQYGRVCVNRLPFDCRVHHCSFKKQSLENGDLYNVGTSH